MADTDPAPAALLPPWAEEVRRTFRGGTVSQFILHGNVHDLVRVTRPGGPEYVPLRQFLDEELFGRFDAVVHYDRARGITVGKGAEPFRDFLKVFDAWNGTSYATQPATLPREPRAAFTVLDRLVRYALSRTAIADGRAVARPLRVGVVVEFAQFIVPRGEAMQLSSQAGETLIQLLDWARDPALLGTDVAVVLLTENLTDLARELVEDMHTTAVRVPLPDAPTIKAYLDALLLQWPGLRDLCALAPDVLAQRLLGLSLVNVRNLVARAVKNDERLGDDRLRAIKRRILETECADLMEFVESERTLDDVAGHVEAKAWLREDARLLREGRTAALPMGYLMAGRIGTGKTFLVTCWAGEIGIPCVVLKNFRDKWMGSTEGNLEKIFNVLHALGQVLVFVDEADQATGKRGGGGGDDSGLSGRVYAMLAKEMSDTRNRGKILWVFATSRPDLLEVDLKRPGRLDVHIPLFPPQGSAERKALLAGMAAKLGMAVKAGDLPDLPDDVQMGGNELESVLVRAKRACDLEAGRPEARPLPEVIGAALTDFRPSAHVDNLAFMDLQAVKECTDARFLPEAYRALTREEVDRRIDLLRLRLGW